GAGRRGRGGGLGRPDDGGRGGLPGRHGVLHGPPGLPVDRGGPVAGGGHSRGSAAGVVAGRGPSAGAFASRASRSTRLSRACSWNGLATYAAAPSSRPRRRCFSPARDVTRTTGMSRYFGSAFSAASSS